MLPDTVAFRMQIIASSLMRKDTKKIKDNIKLIKKVLGASKWEKGYLLALNGIISSVDTNDVQTLAYKLAEQKLSKSEIKEALADSKRIVDQSFRPDFERGYELAWIDLLKHVKDL